MNSTPVQPSLSQFETKYTHLCPQVVWTELVGDLETPVSAMLKVANGRAFSFLLESVEGGTFRGRYSFLGLKPDLIWRCFANCAEINRQALINTHAFSPCPVGEASGALASLRALIAENKVEIPPTLPPMAAGLVGYLGYDMVRLMERLPDENPNVLGVPDGLFMRPTVVAVFDNVEDTITVITPVWPDENISAEEAYESANRRIAETVIELESSLTVRKSVKIDPAPQLEPVSNIKRERYHEIVEIAKEYIAAGDIFQVVPSQRFMVPFKLPPFSLYRALRRLNPSPFLFFLDFGEFAVVGSSPEIMVRLRNDKVTIRPIAGTRPRGRSTEEDLAFADELLADPKERAEHLMLLDLGRNDVGRVSEVGTVKVTEQMIIERYSHVMHIVSNVEGKINPKYDAISALIAGFPAGTVSGAPKVRAMEIIDELEPERRGVYGGCIGYIDANGDMDTCIALRTAIIKDEKLYVQAGGGVVADSDPELEYQETRNKARALLRAAEEARKFFY